MANTAVVGTLRALLQLNTAEYEAGMKRSAASTKAFAKAAEAEVAPALAKVEAQMQRTGAASQRMVSYLQGDKLLKSANDWVVAVNKVGGATKLTEQEQSRLNATLQRSIEKYKALGQTAPKAVLDLERATRSANKEVGLLQKTFGGTGSSLIGSFTAAFGITALVMGAVAGLKSLVAGAFESASALVDLSNKTGLSIETLQRMDYVAGQTGGTLEQFSDASFRLGARLAGGSTSVNAALEALGLNLKTIQAMNPDQQFERIAQALSEVDDSTTRNKLGIELFGKSFANVAAAVAEGYGEMAKGARVASDAQVRELDRLSDQFSAFIKDRKTALMAFGGSLLELPGAVRVDRLPKDRVLAPESTTPARIRSYVQQLAELDAQIAKLTVSEKKEIDAALALGVKMSELEDQFGLTDGALSRYKAGLAALTRETTKAKDETKKLKEEVFLPNEMLQSGRMTAGPAALDTHTNFAALLNSSFVNSDQLADAVEESKRLADDQWQAWKSATERVEAREKESQDRIDALRNQAAEQERERQQRYVEGWTQAIMAVGSVIANGIQSGQSTGDTAFNATVTAVGMIPGYGTIAAMGLAIGKGIIDAQEAREDRNVQAEQNFHTVMAGLSTSLGAGQTGTLMARVGAGLADVYRDIGLSAKTAQDDLVALHEASKESAEAYEKVLQRINHNLQRQSDLTDARQRKQELLNQAVERYGLTMEEAGRLFQRGTLADQAELLIQDFKLLVESGADPSIIAQRMAGAASVFVQQAVKTGTEIPEAMRPMLREMASLGLLLDENGVRFQIEMLAFGNELESMFERVLDKLEALIDALSATKQGEIAKGEGDGVALVKTGGAGVGGKTFPLAHRGMFIGRDEHPIIVQNGEAVLNRFAVAMLGGRQGIEALNGPGAMPDPYSAMQMGQAGLSMPWMAGSTPTTTGWSGNASTDGPLSVSATVNVYGIQDPAEISREIARRLPQELSRNTYGLRSKMRRSLRE